MTETEGLSSLRRLILCGFVFLTVLFSLLLLLLSVFLIIKDKKDEEEVSLQYYYQSAEFNEVTNETLLGVVSILDEMKEDFVYQFNDNGKHSLISQFGVREYRCHGSCMCVDGKRMSLLGQLSTLSRGVTYLVGAASSLMAVNLAKKYFEEECRTKFSDECFPPNSIISEFDDCTNVYNEEEEEGEEEEEEEEGEELEGGLFDFFEKKSKKRRFWCFGTCLTRKSYFGISDPRVVEEAIEFSKRFGCERMEASGETIVGNWAFELGELERNPDEKFEERYARIEFQKERLNDMCRTAGIDFMGQNAEEKVNNIDSLENYLDEISPCVSSHEGEDNPTIRCRLLEGFVEVEDW